MTKTRMEEKTILKKITMLAIVCALALGLAAPAALANTINLSLTDDYYVGSVDPGAPASPADEVAYINKLITVTPGGTATVSQTTPPKSWFYDRSDNIFADLPTVTTAGGIGNTDPPGTDIYVDSFVYILGKYGNVSHVWYVADLTMVNLPTRTEDGGLSHYSRYGSSTTVPDGGMTLILLGGALVGLEGLRRKYRV